MNTYRSISIGKNAYAGYPAMTGPGLPKIAKTGRIEDLQGNIRTLHRNEYLFQMGTSVSSLYVVCGGALKCYMVASDGEEQVVAFYRTGDLLAFDAFANGRANCNVVAIDATVVRAIPANTVLKACRENAEIQHQLLQGMYQEINRLTGMLQLERCPAEQRVAAFLLEQSEFEAGRGCSRTEFTLPMSRTDLGKYLNLATETISRTFSRLQEQGLLVAHSKRIHLKNLSAIQKLAKAVSGYSPNERLCA